MHPAYRSDKPGKAPDCGMDLVPVYADGLGKSLVASDTTADGLSIDSATQKIYGIQLASVEKDSGTRTIRAFGKVAPDDTRIFKVTVGTDGYVKETENDAVGNHVKKEEHMAVIYSHELQEVDGSYVSSKHARYSRSRRLKP